MMFPPVRDLAAEGIPVRLTCGVLGFSPQRDVIFISVVECGTRDPSGTRQNRCQEIESLTSRHNGSKPSW
jgi:hypothetical protein